MADAKISELTSLTGEGAAQNDLLPIVDVSTSTTKKITREEFFKSVDYIGFDTTNVVVNPIDGQLTWDADENTLSLGLNGGSSVLQIGQETHYRVRNQTGSTIPNGTVVYGVGTLGNSGRILVAPFTANGSVNSRMVLGITTENIASGADGLVTAFGKVRGVNTSAFTEGDILYASPSVAGGLTRTRPFAPNNVVSVAKVISSSNNGTLFARPLVEDFKNIFSDYTRAEAVAALAAGWVPENGKTYTFDGLLYRGQTGATSLPGLPGLVPAGRRHPLHYGAVAGNGDAYTVLQAYADDTKMSDEFWIPEGEWAVSQTVILRSHRSTIDFEGRMTPHGSFSDFLFELRFNGADPGLINVGHVCTVKRMEFDCRWQSRGVKFDNIYLSSLSHIIVLKPYGTAIRVNVAYENSFYSPTITLGRNRPAPWLATVADWDAGTTYSVGAVVRAPAPNWSAGTTYGVNQIVRYEGVHYMCAEANTVGTVPGTAPDRWTRIPHEYYQAVAATTNQDPLLLNNSSNSPGGPWMQVLAHEPLLDLRCDNLTQLIDHQYFYGLDIRDCDHKILIAIDNMRNERPVVNMSFFGSQIHSMTPGVPERTDGVLTNQGDDTIFINLGRVKRSKFYDANVRIGPAPNSYGYVFGSRNSAKQITEMLVEGDISGEAEGQIGILVMPSTTAGNMFIRAVNGQFTQSSSRLIQDPAQRLGNRMSVPQRVSDGTAARPSWSYENEITSGWFRRLAGIFSHVIAGIEAFRITSAFSGAYRTAAPAALATVRTDALTVAGEVGRHQAYGFNTDSGSTIFVQREAWGVGVAAGAEEGQERVRVAFGGSLVEAFRVGAAQSGPTRTGAPPILNTLRQDAMSVPAEVGRWQVQGFSDTGVSRNWSQTETWATTVTNGAEVSEVRTRILSGGSLFEAFRVSEGFTAVYRSAAPAIFTTVRTGTLTVPSEIGRLQAIGASNTGVNRVMVQREAWVTDPANGAERSEERLRVMVNGTLTQVMSVGANSTGQTVLRVTLPTSAAGLASGSLWNDAGTVKIVP